MPTMMPAVAVVAATGRTPRPPAASARASRRGHSAAAGLRKLSPTASSIAIETARKAVSPRTISSTMARSEMT
ncbi:hypothetical protein D3C83_18580 [compost metagenome]